MSDSSRIAAAAMATKPPGLPYAHFPLNLYSHQDIINVVNDDACSAAYNAALSYSEALKGIANKGFGWSTVKLYYSCFYCIKSCLLLDKIISFHYERYYLYDLNSNKIAPGGNSSHHWNWNSFKSIKRLNRWTYSEDSQKAYEILRESRERANYKYAFPDPVCPPNLKEISTSAIGKHYTTYRGDSNNLLTYLPNHVGLAYPTQLLVETAGALKLAQIQLSEDRLSHLKKVWPLKEAHPFK